MSLVNADPSFLVKDQVVCPDALLEVAVCTVARVLVAAAAHLAAGCGTGGAGGGGGGETSIPCGSSAAVAPAPAVPNSSW